MKKRILCPSQFVKFGFLGLLFLFNLSQIAIAQQATAQHEEVAAIRNIVNTFLNSGKIDTIRAIAYKGRALSRAIDDTKNASYFSYVLGTTYRYENQGVSKAHYDTALNGAFKSDYEILKMLVYSGLATLSTNKGKLDSALYFHQKNYEILNRQPESKRKTRAVASYMNNVGMVYRDKGDLAKSMESFLGAYEANRKINNLKSAHIALYNLGNTYGSLKMIHEAEEAFQKILDYADSTDHEQLKVMANMGIAKAYQNRYDDSRSLKFYRKALHYMPDDYKSGLREVMTFMAQGFALQGQLDSAIYYLAKAKAMVDSDNDRYYINHKLISATILFQEKELEKAYSEAVEAVNRARLIKAQNILSQCLKLLSDIVIAQKDYQMGFQFFKEYSAIQDSLMNLESRESIVYSDLKLKSELNKEKINNLQQLANSQELIIYRKNELVLITLGLSILIIILSFTVYYYRLKVSSNKEILSRVKLANAQLNPHFLFNSLGAIQQLVLEKENELLISNYIAKFSKLTRDMLNFTEEESITLCDELNFLNNYLSLQVLRFDESFQYEIKVSEELDLKSILVPPLITQPFIENSLEHAFIEDSADNKLIISISENKGVLRVILEDNGVGINNTLNIKKSENQSMAIQMTNGRLRFWSKKTGKKADLDIIDLSELAPATKGTRVTLNLPYL